MACLDPWYSSESYLRVHQVAKMSPLISVLIYSLVTLDLCISNRRMRPYRWPSFVYPLALVFCDIQRADQPQRVYAQGQDARIEQSS